MADVNERLRNAAKAGSEVKMKSLLQEDGCDALSKDVYGMTALMWAARSGHDECVLLLLPVSEPLAKDKNGLTASAWARVVGMKV